MRHHPSFFPWAAPVAALVCAAALAPAQQQAGQEYDVEGLYLKGYMLVMEAEKLEKAGNFAGSFFKYQSANDVFDSVARGYPNWQRGMVDARRTLVRKKMEETRQRERDRRAAAATDPAAPGASELLPELGDPSAPPFSNTPPPPASVRPAVPYQPPAAGIDRQFNQMDQRLQGYNSQAEELQRRLRASEEELFKVKQELLSSGRERNEAMRKQADLLTQLNTADSKRAREVAELKKQLAAATEALEKASASQNDATQKIDGLLGELSQARQTISQLTKERDDLAAEKNQLLALVQGKEGMSGVDALLADNKRLKQQLDEANAKVTSLAADKEAAAKEAASLRDQIAKVRDELDRVKKENEDYRTQIADLRGKLEDTTSQLADASLATKGDSELAEENRQLRKIITDQLKHQTFREEKKRLALEQLAKLQVNNEELLNTLDQIAAPPPSLSAEDTQRLQDPVISRFVENQGLSGTLIARAEPGALPPADPDAAHRPERAVRRRNDLAGDLQTVADAGIAAFNRNRVTEARRAFQTILQEDPTNVFALSNLAVAQVKQQDFAGAEKTLKKALAYDEQDGFCHYLLGLASYRGGKWEEAERSLINALQFDEKNARAYFTLGCVENKLGSLDKALDAFNAAISLEPAYADAHYNLAVIHASRGDLEKASQHYQSAVENGSARDTALEAQLGVSSTASLGAPDLPR